MREKYKTFNVTYYIENDWTTTKMLISLDDLKAFHESKLDFLPGMVDDGELFSINGAMVYTIKETYN